MYREMVTFLVELGGRQAAY